MAWPRGRKRKQTKKLLDVGKHQVDGGVCGAFIDPDFDDLDTTEEIVREEYGRRREDTSTD
jgi:hypothetical protein